MAKRKSVYVNKLGEKQSECEKLLDEALAISKDCTGGADAEWILDWAGRQEELSEYGYTVELQEEVEDLEKRLLAYPAEPPKIENMVDRAKYEFFMANFAKIPLASLEWVVATVDKNKLTV